MPIEFFTNKNTAKVLLEVLPEIIAEILFEEVVRARQEIKNMPSVGR